ncbi:MAG TPA: hypothetical protein ENI67_04835 [Gammaproteobacteria bacterium]|nr:hypothetical protein [Gammaproteobacteria bacterium]
MAKSRNIRYRKLIEMGCIACRNQHGCITMPEIHHVRYLAGMGQRAPDTATLPLCPRHHRIGGYKMSLHCGQKAWEEIFGTEKVLLDQVNKILEELS